MILDKIKKFLSEKNRYDKKIYWLPGTIALFLSIFLYLMKISIPTVQYIHSQFNLWNIFTTNLSITLAIIMLLGIIDIVLILIAYDYGDPYRVIISVILLGFAIGAP